MKRRAFLCNTLLFITGIYCSPFSATEKILSQSDFKIDIEKEKMILGKILFDNSSMSKLIYRLKPFHFHSVKNKIIFRSMSDLYAKGEPIDLVTLIHSLLENEDLERSGDEDYITSLVS